MAGEGFGKGAPARAPPRRTCAAGAIPLKSFPLRPFPLRPCPLALLLAAPAAAGGDDNDAAAQPIQPRRNATARADAAESVRRWKARRRCRKATAPTGTSEVLRGTQGRQVKGFGSAYTPNVHARPICERSHLPVPTYPFPLIRSHLIRTRRTSTRGRSASAPSCRGRRRPTARRPASETEGTWAGTHGVLQG